MSLFMIQFLIFLSLLYKFNCFPGCNFTGQFDQVTSHLGLNATYSHRHYAGYLPSLNDTNIFYWFFESQSAKPENDPVVLWLNGGPACSSLYGALLEIGPFQVSSNGTVYLNPNSWNTNANLLFLESPAGVGFSYKTNVSDDHDYTTDDSETAQLNFEALCSFYRKFPHYTANDLYLTGESYGGIYLPMLSSIVLERKFPPNFKGISIGNGWLEQRYVFHSRIQFAHQHRLINDSLWSSLLKSCFCRNGTNTVLDCPFLNLTAGTAYTLGPPDCKDRHYDIYSQILQHPRNAKNYKEKCVTRKNFVCTDEQLQMLNVWFNRADVQKALHVVKPDATFRWTECNMNLFRSYHRSVDSVLSQFLYLLEKKIKVLLYYGDLDLVGPYFIGEWFIDDLNITAVANGTSDWLYDNQFAATMQVYQEGLVYVKIKEAGHEAVRDKPAFSKFMFSQFLNSALINVTDKSFM